MENIYASVNGPIKNGALLASFSSYPNELSDYTEKSFCIIESDSHHDCRNMRLQTESGLYPINTEMIQEEIQSFASDGPVLLPELLDASCLKTSFVSDEFAVLSYKYECGYKMEEILNMLKEQMSVVMLYDTRVSESTSYGRSCCAYSNPVFGKMFKLNAKTDGNGLVPELSVTLYESMEFMSQDIFDDYNSLKEANCTGYFRPMLDVIGDLF